MEQTEGKNAINYFHAEDGLNCAQAILTAYQNEFNIKDEHIKEYKQYGGGRAEGGVCGALYAIKKLIKDEAAFGHIKREFFHAAGGSAVCKEIRKSQQLSCVGCVEVADKLLYRYVKENNKPCEV
ncbi:MAG: hypothetical protein E3K37_12195 [Candidatus Kuenenia sp.]|nr:hypothetical protein [Candidatus Kuenenia hertensis]